MIESVIFIKREVVGMDILANFYTKFEVANYLQLQQQQQQLLQQQQKVDVNTSMRVWSWVMMMIFFEKTITSLVLAVAEP